MTLFFISLPAIAQEVRPYTLTYSNSLHGGHTLFGNTILAIKNSAGAFDLTKMNDFGSYTNGATSQYGNDNNDMQFVDVDGSLPPTSIISSGDAWSYSTAASAPAGWPVVSATLPGGPSASPLGYGPTGSVGTTLSDIRTYYFEKKVSINPASFSGFTFNLTVDDGAVVYVNGTEVGRVNMPAGAVSFTTNASSNLEPEQTYSFTVGAGAPFINGTNSITVEVHTSASNETGTDDLFFDAQLLGNSINATQSSSSADLNMPAGSVVKFARLIYGGRIHSGDGGAGNINLRSVKIKYGTGAGAYSSILVPAAQVDKVLVSGSDSAYQAYVDITSFVATGGSGTYSLADIKAATGSIGSGGNYAGWAIEVVYENAAMPFSSIRLYDGYIQVYNGGSATTQSIVLNGFNAPDNPLSATDAVMSVMAWEGDGNLAASNNNPAGDFVKINGNVVSDASNPAVNFFNGSISQNGVLVTSKNPNYSNQMGIDIDRINVGVGYGIAANATSVTVEFGTEADQYFPSVFGFTLVSKDPSVTLDKTVSDELPPYGVLQTNETLTYTLSGSNMGVGSAYNTTVVDTIPSNVTYVPGSLEIVSSPGITAGFKTDAAGDDEAFKGINVANSKEYVKYYLGTGATNAVGGVLDPSETYELRFKVITTSNSAALSTVSNTARITANSLAGEEFIDDGTAIIGPAGGPLPVKMSSFNVKKDNAGALLNWVTQSEIKNDEFVIERSLDGIKFSGVGSVKGNGTTSTMRSYQFNDALLGVVSKIVYYRLRVVDIDGKSSYTKIVSLRLDGSLVINKFSVYPNPFVDNIKLNISSDKEQSLTLRISNVSGQQVIKRIVMIEPGDNIVVLKDLGNLPKGAHLLEVISADGILSQKIMKN